MDTTAAVLAEADQELYSDDEFEVEVKAPIAPIGQKPTGKTRAEILKSAANIVAEEEEREVTAALKNVSAELQREIEDEELQVRDVPVSAGPPHTALRRAPYPALQLKGVSWAVAIVALARLAN